MGKLRVQFPIGDFSIKGYKIRLHEIIILKDDVSIFDFLMVYSDQLEWGFSIWSTFVFIWRKFTDSLYLHKRKLVLGFVNGGRCFQTD